MTGRSYHMKNMSLQTIAAVCGGTYYGPEALLEHEAAGVVIDSRLIQRDFLFVPIRGARVDGHTFIPDVMAKGALCSLSEEVLQDAAFPYIQVASCKEALKALAAHYRRSLSVKVVGITGSVGKTSTKETIAAILSERYKVHKTSGNFNNEIGLPLTIFEIKDDDEIAVLEMGINGFGEMSRLAAIAQPDIAVITNIGTCHLEFLNDRAGVLKAKTEMFSYLREGGTAILNGDDDMLRTVRSVNGKPPIFFGLGSNNKFRAENIRNKGFDGTDCTLFLDGASVNISIPAPGQHMVYNILAASAVGTLLDITPGMICTAAAKLTPMEGRGKLLKTSRFTIMDDCYNANPISVKSSLDLLSAAAGRKVAILGDMLELGVNELALHRETGAYAAQKKIDLILCAGSLSRATAEGASDGGKSSSEVHAYRDKDELLQALMPLLKQGDTILVKASHAMQFEEIVAALGDNA